MIKTQKIDELIELALWSAYVEKEKPVSLLLVAPPESGKSQSLIKYIHNNGIVVFSDCTAVGIINGYGDTLRNGEIRHFFFTDLITPMSKAVDARNSFVALLNNLVEEGVFEINTHFMKIKCEIPHPVGIIGCITDRCLADNRHHWDNIGFMSRLIPVSWQYSSETVNKIFESIANQDYLHEKPVKIGFPLFNETIQLDAKYAKDLYNIGRTIKQDSSPYGFRLARQLHVLAKASALKNSRSEVNGNDIDKIMELREIMNLDFKQI